MKIAVYKDNLSTGRGADHLICAIAGGLAERGFEVTLVTCPYADRPTFDLPRGVEVRTVERVKVRDFVGRGFDLCIAAGSNEMMDLTEKGNRKPPVVTVAMMLLAPRGFFKWKRFLRNRQIKRSFDRSDVLQILCPSYEKEVRTFAPSPEISVIAEWPDVRKPTDGELAGEKRKNVVIYPAAVNKLKNQLLLIEAFSLIAGEFPDWELHIYGKHHRKYGDKCRRLVDRFGLRDRIRFFPFTEDLASVYASAEIMAFPSLLEGFPLTILEGMLFSLPSVVVDALPGSGDIVADGETGIIARADRRSYAEALRRLMSDTGLRRDMGCKARKFCLEHYSRDNILSRWEKLITDLTRG